MLTRSVPLNAIAMLISPRADIAHIAATTAAPRIIPLPATYVRREEHSILAEAPEFPVRSRDMIIRALLLSFALLQSFAAPALVESRRIWDAGAHNAFTDLIRHDGKWLCVFREGAGHVSPGGKIRVIESKDGKEWRSAALVTMPERDLRDPHIAIAPDGRLMLYAAAADRPKTPVTHQSVVWFSDDGVTWTAPAEVADKNVWLWRVAWNGKQALGVGYDTSGEKFARLYKTTDGVRYETLIDKFHNEEQPNESGIAYEPNGDAWCLLRRDGKPGLGLLGFAKPPYTNWKWQDVGAKIGGPQLLRLPNGRLIAGVRLYAGGARTAIVELNRETGKLTELVKLPSGGDTSYPGMVWHDNKLHLTYYSSHEGKTMIYLALVAL